MNRSSIINLMDSDQTGTAIKQSEKYILQWIVENFSDTRTNDKSKPVLSMIEYDVKSRMP